MGRVARYTVGKDGGRWYVNISAKRSPTGKRERRYFRTKEEALAESDRLKATLVNYGRRGNMLPADAAADAARAIGILEPVGASLTQAARDYVSRHSARGRSIEYSLLADHYVDANGHLRERTKREYQQAVAKIDLGDRIVSDITTEEIRAALDENSASDVRWNLYRRCLNRLFNFAYQRGWCAENPVARIESKRVDGGRARILAVKEARGLMRAAESYEAGVMVPYFALTLFGGVRPDEAKRLKWEDVDFDGPHIYVAAGTSKTRTDRYVEMTDNLVEWLRPRAGSGRVVDLSAHDYRRHFDAVRELAGLKSKWQQDILRHTAASFLWAACQSQSHLEDTMGHSVSVSLRHYRRAVTKEQAIEFWKIVPKGVKPPETIKVA